MCEALKKRIARLQYEIDNGRHTQEKALQKCKRRLAANRAEAERRGTGQLEIEIKNRQEDAANQYRKTLQQLAEVRAKGWFKNPNYKGPPEWAFLKALDNLRRELPLETWRAIDDEH